MKLRPVVVTWKMGKAPNELVNLAKEISRDSSESVNCFVKFCICDTGR